MEEFETIPQTLRVDAMNRAWKFIKENSFYGMYPYKHPQSRVQAAINKVYMANVERYLRRKTPNNKLKRLHIPMKRQPELTDLDKMVKRWKKHCKRKGIKNGRL